MNEKAIKGLKENDVENHLINEKRYYTVLKNQKTNNKEEFKRVTKKQKRRKLQFKNVHLQEKCSKSKRS
jgi:hypothetical protein